MGHFTGRVMWDAVAFVMPPAADASQLPPFDGVNRAPVCLATISGKAGPTINLTRLAAVASGQEGSEAVKLGIVCRAAEDGSLGWKFLLQHVADDAKALPAISRARSGAMSQAPETTRFGKGAAARRLRGTSVSQGAGSRAVVAAAAVCR
jgi:hypothetical protein